MARSLLISLLLLLVAMVTGCGGANRYDGRLVAVDSLMKANPDSALALVEALSPDSLANDGDRAYRDLLLTQARYKCYIKATSDSDINRALDYYRHYNNDREKLTRAYIYKGAVMEELGHPDSAMYYYKTAEAAAAPDDYANLGYVNLQMGAIYSSYYIMDGQDVIKYEDALNCYRHTTDTVYLLKAMNNLGCLYRASNPELAESLLMESSSLARHMQDSLFIIYNDISLIQLYQYQDKLKEARQLIWEVSDFGLPVLDYTMCFAIADVYSKLGITDSAELYVKLGQQRRGDNESLYKMYYLHSLAELALSRNHKFEHLQFESESKRIEDSLILNGKKLEILFAETGLEKNLKSHNQRIHQNTVLSYRWIIVAILLTLILLALHHYYKVHRYDRLISELKAENENQSLDLKTLQSNIQDLKISDVGLRECLSSHIILMRDVMDACYHAPRNLLAEKIRELIRFQDSNKDVWSRLYQSIDTEYNSIMSYTKSQFPQLNDKDLLMIALTCMGYSCAQIAIILDYSTATSISTIRTRIASKMGLDCTLIEYIDFFKASNSN